MLTGFGLKVCMLNSEVCMNVVYNRVTELSLTVSNCLKGNTDSIC